MKTLWHDIPCDHKVEKVEDHISITFIHAYDFGLMDFDIAGRSFSGYSFDAQSTMRKIKEGFWNGANFIGGARNQFIFTAKREGDKVHVTMEKRDNVYKFKAKMI